MGENITLLSFTWKRADSCLSFFNIVHLSFGDRACLVLARKLDLPAFTTDRAWEVVEVNVSVRIIR